MFKQPSQAKGRIAHHVTNEPTTLSRCLQKHFRLEPHQIEELLALGAIYSDRKRVFEDRPLSKGVYLRIHLQPKRFRLTEIHWNKVIVEENEAYVVVNKPAGIPVHATVDNQQDNLLAQLRLRLGYPLFVTQRLDIPVGGLMVYARTQSFQRQFNRWLVERKVRKSYLALVEELPPVGHHVHFMEVSPRAPKRLSDREQEGWQRCELGILSSRSQANLFEAEIELYTGRTHQIRAQLSFLGSPIHGDTLYGGSETAGGQIALFSSRLAFPQWEEPPRLFQLDPPWK